MKSTSILMGIEAQAEGLDKLSKDLKAVATSTSQQISRVLVSAEKMGLTSVSRARMKSLKEYEKQTNAAIIASSRATTESERKVQREKLKNIQNRVSQEFAAENKLIALHEKALEERETKMKKMFHEVAEDFGDSMSGVFDRIQSKDLAGLSKGFLKTMGGAAIGRGAAAMKQGAETGQASNMGKALSTLGRSAMMLAAVVGGLAAVVKLLVDADAQAKEFNQSLLNGGAAADLVGGNIYDLSDALGNLRKSATESFELWDKFRASNKEQLETLAALNAAGLTYQKITAGAKTAAEQQEAYTKAAQTAIMYARVFNESSTEIAKSQAEYMEDLGLGLKTVEEQFASIHQVAMTAGFGVKRFYSMVLQATSGLAGYNVRIDEAAGLLQNLSKAMGPKQAEAFLQTLTKGFSQEGMTESLKRVVTTGRGTTKSLVRSSIMSQAEGFFANADKGKLNELLATAGIGPVGSSQDLAKALAAAPQSARNQLSANASGILGDNNARAFDALAQSSTGLNAKGVGELAMALENLDAGGTLAMKLSATKAALGVDVDQLNDPKNWQKATAAEQALGISREQRIELGKVGRRLRGQYDQSDEKLGGMSFSDYVSKTGARELEKALEKTASPAEKSAEFAKLISEETIAQTGILEKGIQYLLEQINDGIQTVVDWLPGRDKKVRLSEGDLQEKKIAIDSLAASRQSSLNQIKELDKEAKDASPERKAAIEQQKKMLQIQADVAEEKQRAVRAKHEKGEDEAFSASSLTAEGLNTAGMARVLGRNGAQGKVDKARQWAKEHASAYVSNYAKKYGTTVEDYESGAFARKDPGKYREMKSKLDSLEQQNFAKEIATEFSAFNTEAEKQTKLQGEAPKDTAEEIGKVLKKQKEEEIAALMRAAGYSAEEIAQGPNAHFKSLTDQGYGEDLKRLGVYGPKVHDFIIGSNGILNPIDSKDQLFNLPEGVLGAKPGGAVSQAVGGGRGGAGMVNHIYITGTNEREIYQGVKRFFDSMKKV